jgi:hypothetical protein
MGSVSNLTRRSASAELNGLTILHLDKDFEVIAQVTGQPVERLSTGQRAATRGDLGGWTALKRRTGQRL